MATLADLTIAALRSGHEALSALVRDLTAEDLTRPSGSSRWQVSQVLSHLGSGAQIGLAALTASQTSAPVPDRDFNRTVWARWDAMPPAEHARGFLEANQLLVEAYESLDAATRAQLQVDLGFLPQPVDVATAARFRLNEFALHRWDVEVSFTPQATVAAEAVELLLDHVKSMLGWISKPDALAGRQATLALRLWEPDRSYGLRLDNRIDLIDVPQHPDGELLAPAEAWLRLAVGRLAAPYTPNDLRLTGPLTLDDLRRTFPGY